MTFQHRRHLNLSEAAFTDLLTVGTSTLGHLRDNGFITDLTPIRRPIRMVGIALTVRIGEYDASALAEAVDAITPGVVLVVSQPGQSNRACIGGIVATRIRAKGAAGLIIDGSITDYDQVYDLDMPVYVRGVSPRITRRIGGEGAFDVPVAIDSAVIRPGDVIFGDSDGIAVLEPAEADEVAADLRVREAREPEMLRRIEEAAVR